MRCPRATSSILVAVGLLVVAGPAPAKRRDTTNPYPGYQSATYADPAHWLCRPDKADVCDVDLEATAVRADGRTKIERWRPARKPKIDCFYVYPTISTDPQGNSDLVPGDDQELFVVRQQAARLGEVCRVFAPVYRQVTLTGLVSLLSGSPIPIDPDVPYADVVDAWKHYVANDNRGRGVVLIGHSQGAGLLNQLIRNEIDGVQVLRDRLVSAMILGSSVQVPAGADVGGDFANVPLCRSRRQTGCAISYVTFRATAPPPANSLFGASDGPGLVAACTNPAALAGGSGTLHPYFPTDGTSLPILPPPSDPVWATGVTVTTPFVTLPDFVDAECAEHQGFRYLSVTVHGDPSDLRIDDIGGDLTPEWGLHLVDANVAMGDLVAVARSQAKAFRGGRRKPSPAPPRY
jgi:hypothetical protein